MVKPSNPSAYASGSYKPFKPPGVEPAPYVMEEPKIFEVPPEIAEPTPYVPVVVVTPGALAPVKKTINPLIVLGVLGVVVVLANID